MDIKRWIFKILDIKRILALGVAGVLWYYVYDLERSIEEYIIPIDFSEKPGDLHTNFEYKNEKLLVDVSGRKEDIEKARLSLGYLRSYVDLRGADEKTLDYKIELRKNGMMNESLSRLKIKMRKSEIRIPFEKVIRKSVPVVLRIKDEQNKENKILGIRYSPRRVMIEGPVSKVKGIESVRAQKYTVQGRSEDFKEELRFEVLGESIKILKHKRVRVYVEIDLGIREEEFRGEEVEVRGLGEGLRIKGGVLRLEYIRYKGPFKFLKRVGKEKFKTYIVINEERNKEGIGRFKIKAKEFEGMEVMDFFPRELEIEIMVMEGEGEVEGVEEGGGVGGGGGGGTREEQRAK